MRIVFPVLMTIIAAGCQPVEAVNIEPKPTGTLPTYVTSTTTSTTTTTTTTTTASEYDCTAIPALPATYHVHQDYSKAEDFDFDGDGYAVAVYDGALVGKNQSGDIDIKASGFNAETSGTRTLSTGDFVVAMSNQGSIKLVDAATNNAVVVMSGLNYPNGVEVDEFDNVYVADQNTGRLIRFNAYNTDDNEVIATDLEDPNGVILSPDGLHLYVGSFGGGIIYAIDQLPDGTWDEPRIIFQSPGNDQGYDGINVDICGNIYWTEFIVGKVRRMSPDGLDVALVANLPSFWIPNLRWGNGIGGWDDQTLYVSDRQDGRIFGLELGVPGRKHVVLP
ncbi:MAG: hypothetical protein GWP91_07170 [Rhodobacterales bacterium]|nr:hypothetical protein [Rhodobacterales bacterium]